MLGRGTDAEPVFACQWFFSCRVLFRMLESELSASFLLFFFFFFFNAEISFHWHGGETCLELYPVPVTFVYKERERQFSVEGVKNVNMSELENFGDCLPTFACVFTQLVYDSSGFSSKSQSELVVQIPLCFPTAPFLFSPWDHAAGRGTDKFSFSPWSAGCEEEQSWLSFVSQEYPQHFLTNLVPSHIVFRGISRVFLITVPVYLPTKSVFSCDFFFFFHWGGRRFAAKEMSSLFPWL